MAIENAKMLNVRIKNKYDSYENWKASGLVLEAGEIAIAYTTVDVAVDNGTAKHPALLMKVGNGTDTFDKLPWMSAKAADVLSVCKNETELKTFISGVITNSKLATAEALATVAEDLDTAEAAILALEALVGDTKVADQISAAITALNLANTYEAKGEAAKVDAKLTSEVTRATAAEEANAAAAKKAQDEVDALELVVATKAAQADLDAVVTKIGAVPEDKTVKEYIDAKTEGIASEEALGELQQSVEALETNKADKTQVATDIANAVAVVQGEVDTLEQTHATDKEALENAIALKADQTALNAVSEVANAAVKQADYDVKVKALEDEDARIVGLVEAEATTARAEEVKLANRIKAVEDDYLKAADKTELANAIATEKERAEGVEASLQTQINTIMNNPDAEGAINSINEFTKYVEEHGTIADGFRTDIDKNKEDIAANAKAISDNAAAQLLVDAEQDRRLALVEAQLGDGEGSVSDMITDALDTAAADAKNKADAALAAAKEDAQNKADAAQAAAEAKAAELATAAQTAAATDAKNKADAAEAAAKAHAETKATEAKDAAIAAAATDATNKANAAQAAAETTAAADATAKANAAQAAAEATAAADATNKADKALADAKTHVAEEIAKLDGSVAVSSDKHVLTGVTEVDGKLTDKTEVKLADIAFSGKTDDLVQGTMTLVFDCGGAA